MAWLLWAAAGASLVFWVLQVWQLAQPRPQALADGASVGETAVPPGGWRVLRPVAGSTVAADPQLAAPWQLLGVAAGRDGRGSALLARTGEPPRTWMVGQSLDGQWRLQRVAPGRAWLVPLAQPDAGALELALPATPVTTTATTATTATAAAAALTPVRPD